MTGAKSGESDAEHLLHRLAGEAELVADDAVAVVEVAANDTLLDEVAVLHR